MVKGRRPSSSARFWAWAASSRAALRASSWARKSDSSARKLRRRSKAFSCLEGLSSCLASWLYSSIVREKEVREAEREPSAAGVRLDDGGCCEVPSDGEEKEGFVRAERSRRIVVLCLSAELKWVFCCVGGRGMLGRADGVD